MRHVWLRLLLSVPAGALAAFCGCPDEAELAPKAEIDWNGFEEKSVTSKKTGQEYTYLHLGARNPGSPTMVLLPGLLFDSRIYLNVHHLAEKYDLVAWNMPGDSPLYEGGYEDIALSLKDFVDSLELSSFVLAGNSLGGQVAIEFFKHRGETEVEGLVLIDTVMLDATPKDKRNRIRGAKFIARRSDKFIECTVKKAVLRAKKTKDGGEAQTNVFNVFEMKPITFFRQVSRALLDYDGESGAELVTCPTLVLHGSEDQLIDVKKTKYTLEAIPHARLEIVKGAGHEGVFSHGEEFSKRILEWSAE
jgi:pimeloyl-ACP methyl ester carboxylesterase